ncbi:MAG: hypothetical protein D6736_00470 [Nitrospinota bacterium]|nr:MAG: hypothetical protein D6736_00470 [Nitrospinota bacterium]
MSRRVISLTIMLGLLVIGPLMQAYAFNCPLMVKQNRALLAQAEKTSLKQKAAAKLAQAQQLTEQALKLHKSGDHVQAMIKANQAATLLAETALAAVP